MADGGNPETHMRNLKITALIVTVLVVVGSAFAAKANKYGVADVRRFTLSSPTRVGDVLLPQGEYEVRHVMEAENHIMVFKQLGTNHPAEARVKCNLVPLQEKAKADQVIYQTAGNERVLQTLRFKGDLAEHVF